ncbi:hypothetical protein TNCV_4538741 [Trichonephila clavipes]|uniref:Uncharacterized protein n=1 Tax=Trichonephila clavipes TaxID=2585209 RepID=A0A8X7BJH8_TRICX|nr:hypothetical protein TNCV_4538741 [Trichonephila clavipes]
MIACQIRLSLQPLPLVSSNINQSTCHFAPGIPSWACLPHNWLKFLPFKCPHVRRNEIMDNLFYRSVPPINCCDWALEKEEAWSHQTGFQNRLNICSNTVTNDEDDT